MKISTLIHVFGFAVFVVSGHRISRESSTEKHTVVQSTSTTPTIHVSSTSELMNSTEKNEIRESWYGKRQRIDDVIGCQWPEDFQYRFNYCANRSTIADQFDMRHVDGAEFGVLDKEIGAQLLEKCSNGHCSDAKINQTDFRRRADLWWHHMDNISEFSKCLKSNSEGMVRLCSSNEMLSQTVSGIAGLHLNIMNVLTQTYARMKKDGNDTELCLAKLSEAVHFTGALYLSSAFYAKNSVLCWEVTKGTCGDTCKQFANTLTCLQSICSALSNDFLKSFGIWEWFYIDVDHAKKTCDVKIDVAQCQSETLTHIGEPTATPSDLLGKSKALWEQAKVKYHDFQYSVEGYTHMKFYQVALIVGGGLAALIGAVVIVCMWYNGLLCERKKKRVLRYTRLIPEDQFGRKTDESKSLTRDYDEVE